MTDVIKLTGGSIAVYCMMAACSASSGTKGFSSSSGASSSGGAPSGSSPVSDANADQTQSGSRLKAEYFVGGDGSKQWDYFFQDSGRKNERCSFQTAGDGTIRCLPSGVSNENCYADAECTSPVGLAATSCIPTYVTMSVPSGTCGGNASTHVYPVIGAHTSGPIYLGGPASAGMTCTAASPPASYAVFAVDPEIPASSFQQATIETE